MAQVTDLGGPISWNRTLKSNQIDTKTMAGFDMAAIQAEDAINDVEKAAPWRFGYKYSTNFSLENSGTWQELDNGKLWRIELQAPGALTMNLILENLYLPEGAQLYLYDNKNTNLVGAYTERNNREDGLLGTELVFGDDIIVEYYEPNDVEGLGHFTIANVVHGYRSLNIIQNQLEKALNSSGNCNIDARCPLGNNWDPQIRSVAMIVVGGAGICTGALINNRCNDGTPYFLTANHCLGGGTGSWAFRFNWEVDASDASLSCATTTQSAGIYNSSSNWNQTANGATILASGTQADHALLEIDNMTMQDAIDWGLYYAGWNHDDTPNSITEATGIHHPSGDIKKICRENDSPSQQNTGGAAVWWIDEWEEGVTEPGSSGSPLFDQNGKIIGQLYGGAAACSGTSNNGAYDFYGRLGVAWNNGVGQYLGASACGGDTLKLDGFDPNPATAATDDIQAIDFTVSPNPSEGVFTLSMNDNTALTGSLIVRDMMGREVLVLDMDEAFTTEIDLTGVSNGAYVLQVQSAKSLVTKTLVVRK